MSDWFIEHGDCLEVLKGAEDNSFDAIVTDPPYGVNADTGSMVGQVAVGKEKRGGFAYGGAHTRGFAEHDPIAFQTWFTEVSREMLRVLKPGGHLLSFGASRTAHRMATAIEDAGFEIRDSISWLRSQGMPKGKNLPGGWSTALKTSYEPIVVARKPLVGTVTANVEQYGTGALNIGATRLEGDRWPPNVVLSHECGESCESCVVTELGRQSEFFPVFRYAPKPAKVEREGNHHPTPKPVDLMRWLVRLVTPKHGVVLDPFCGSGSTGVAALMEGFDFVGVEREAEYVEIARNRIDSAAVEAADNADTESA